MKIMVVSSSKLQNTLLARHYIPPLFTASPRLRTLRAKKVCLACMNMAQALDGRRKGRYEKAARKAGRIADLGPTPRIYQTSYCNKGHYLHDGVPCDHECSILPPTALYLERVGMTSAAVEIIEASSPLKKHRGVRLRFQAASGSR